jgi:hypothetical protein|tara:strand:- start:4353 stop:4523 length:171 start_codon:yes stop_codon:yes gene_type:complete
MLVVLKPIILKFVASSAVKRFLLDLLREMAKKTDNQVDDHCVKYVEQLLFPGSMPE